MARTRALVAPAAAVTVLLAGCAGPGSQDVARADESVQATAMAEAGPATTGQGRWYASWEEAAIAEAQRLHPGLAGVTAERVDLTTLDERVVVRAASGFCAVYGGRAVEGRWQADEVMVLRHNCGE